MKDGTRTGVALQTKREEKEDLFDKDEQLFCCFCKLMTINSNIEIFAFVTVILI